MIISASRRTDIPAFYADWFMNRIREGYCTVPNPFNPKQISRISLKPEDVDVIVFWTRYARPLLPLLNEMNDRGYRYYFLYTLMNNPRVLDPKAPSHKRSLNTFRELSHRIGKEKVVWRYDPIVFSTITDTNFHKETYHRIAEDLKGYTTRSVISIVDIYRKVAKRLRLLENRGIQIAEPTRTEFNNLMKYLSVSARANDMEIQTCAEKPDLSSHGISSGKCINDDLIRKVFNLHVTSRKDPSQRAACGCVASRDIGMYDTCRFGCVYCYATTSVERARNQHRNHKSASPSMTGCYGDNKGL
ncbi:MAG: DUF1848 domain-containing protein [Deltaproteobacteria bacterium]|nr:DUF1848 domain-containing protein [Deltaproteobacteria bacterium]